MSQSYLKKRMSLEEYLEIRTKQHKGTGRGTKSAVKNADLFCQDQYQKEFVTVLGDLREEVFATPYPDVEVCLVFLQKLIYWMAEPHLEMRMTPNPVSKKGALCIAKDVDSIRGYIAQIRLIMYKVGGIPIFSEHVKGYRMSYPPMADKEEPEPMTLDELRLICDAQPDFKRQMLYRCKKDFESRIAPMVQLIKEDFDTTGFYESKGKIPITVTFRKSIMKKKNGISFSNKKYVIQEDEKGVLKLLDQTKAGALVFGTNENVELAVNNEEKTWSKLVCDLGFTRRYKHNNHLVKNLHSIKALTFTAARKAVDTDYAHAYGDHAEYCKNYLRLSDEEKIAYFKRLEPFITMYTKTKVIHDNEALYQENIVLKKKMADHDVILKKLSEEKMSQTSQIPDDKMQEMFDKYMKDKFTSG